MALVLSLFLLLPRIYSQLMCSDGYSCYEDPNQDIIWVSRHEYVTYGPHCTNQCQEALVNMDTYYACDHEQPVMYDRDSFADIASGLGFTCQSGSCWDGNSPAEAEGVILVSSGSGSRKKCYFPPETYNNAWSCTSTPDNANCFGDRFSLICPCTPKALDEACVWNSPPNQPSPANWGDPEGINACCTHTFMSICIKVFVTRNILYRSCQLLEKTRV